MVSSFHISEDMYGWLQIKTLGNITFDHSLKLMAVWEPIGKTALFKLVMPYTSDLVIAKLGSEYPNEDDVYKLFIQHSKHNFKKIQSPSIGIQSFYKMLWEV